MKKLIFLSVFFLSGCYTPVGMWFRSNFTCSCPNRYEKVIIKDSCNSETVKLKLEEHLWRGRSQDIPELLARMRKQVIDEKLYINDIVVGNWRGDRTVIIFASNIPTSLKDKDELAKHKYHKIREEKCDCRLCK